MNTKICEPKPYHLLNLNSASFNQYCSYSQTMDTLEVVNLTLCILLLATNQIGNNLVILTHGRKSNLNRVQVLIISLAVNDLLGTSSAVFAKSVCLSFLMEISLIGCRSICSSCRSPNLLTYLHRNLLIKFKKSAFTDHEAQENHVIN